MTEATLPNYLEEHNGFSLKWRIHRAKRPILQKTDFCINSDMSPAQMALYEESCCRLRVLVIADFSDAEYERCTLQVVENLGLDATPCTPEVGAQFAYLRRRDALCHGMARLIRDV